MQKQQDVAADPLVIFTGTKVTLQFTGDIQYYAGGWKTFTQPSTNLLPGTYPFRFSGTGYPAVQINLTIAGSEMVNSIAYMRLINHSGTGLPDGMADYYISGWQSGGTTNSAGAALVVIPGLKSTAAFRMGYGGASIQKSQNIAADSFVTFQTKLVSMKLLQSDGFTELTGTSDYYGSGWKTFGGGTTLTSMEMLPTTFTFRISYGGASIQKSQNVASDPNVVFQTKLVTMKLLAMDGVTELTGGADYYASGWKTFDNGSTTTSMELLPTSYTFRVSYGGASVQKQQNVNADQLVVFQTGQVHSDSAAATQYYAGGWKTVVQDMELLPASYPFKFNDGTPQTTYPLTAGVVNHIH